MNLKSETLAELTRPATSAPTVVISAGPPDAAYGVPVSRAAVARPASSTALSPMSILRALRRRQILALGVAILAAGISGPAAWFLVPPAKYKAQARLQVAAQTPKVLYKTVEAESLGGDDYKRYQTTQLTLVKSQLALNAALEDKVVRKYRMVREQIDPIFWLQENLKVEFLSGSEVMEISLTGDVPEELAGIVNAVKKAYIEEVVNVDLKRRMERFDKLKGLKDQYAGWLKERRDALRKLAETVGSDDRETLALRQQYALEHLDSVRKELEVVQSQIRKAQARLKTQRPEETTDETTAIAASPTVSESDINEWIDQHPDIVSLFDRLAHDKQLLSSETDSIRSISRNAGADPVLRRLRVAVQATEKMIRSERAALRPVAIRQLREGRTGDQHIRGNDDQRELAMFNDLEQRLKLEIKSITDGNQSLTNKTLDLQSQQDEIVQMQHSATTIGTEVEALTVELGAPPRIRTIEDAVVPRTRDEKKRLMIIAMTIFGAFFGGLFGIAFLELQNRKVDSADEVPLDLGLRVVGTLPIVRSRVNRGGIALKQNQSDRYSQNLMLESIDATRTILVHAARTGSHRVVMITSAVAGEGKTSLASHLATSLARSGLRTVLIDADLRSPSIHRLFSLPVDAGLSEVLRGEVDLPDAIAATAIDDLKILTAGQCDRRTIRLLSQGGLGPLFARLKEQFDFVIVDTSPILLVADALIIAQQADAALFSIYRDVSSKTKVSAALERLQSLGVRVLGAVVTGAHGGRYGNAYDQEGPYALLPESAADSFDSSLSP
jgi:polysaccharide biosynthesis transport protein